MFESKASPLKNVFWFIETDEKNRQVCVLNSQENKVKSVRFYDYDHMQRHNNTNIFDVDRFEFITDGKLATWRNDPIPPDINAMPLEAHPLP